MITIVGRRMIIPKAESVVGFQGDNLVETKEFELDKMYNNTDLSLFDFKLDLQIGTDKNTIDLAKNLHGEKIVLTWTVTEAHLKDSGLAQIQIRAFSNSDEKWHSNIEYITIKQSINASEAFPDPLPSEFEEMEIRITAAKNTAVEANENATLKAREAFESAEDAAEQVSRVNTAGDTQVARVEAVLEEIVVVGKTAPGFGIWLEEV